MTEGDGCAQATTRLQDKYLASRVNFSGERGSCPKENDDEISP